MAGPSPEKTISRITLIERQVDGISSLEWLRRGMEPHTISRLRDESDRIIGALINMPAEVPVQDWNRIVEDVRGVPFTKRGRNR